MKFKVGDKVVLIDDMPWIQGVKYRVITEVLKEGYHLSDTLPLSIWYDHELKLYEEEQKYIEPQTETEFTFQEVVARNIPGIYVNCNDGSARIKTVTVSKSGYIHIDAKLHETGENRGVLGIYPEVKFKLQESKKRVRIYKIEHQKNGKQYDFISSQLLDCDEFVICDTKCGKSYGRIADVRTIALTETEISNYKECWRV